MASSFVKTMTSFSGADLIVNFGPKVIGELQQISWAVEREKAPVYTLGSADPRSFSRGKRAIAGSLVFAVFDRDALITEMTDAKTWGQIAPDAMFTAAGNLTTRFKDGGFENALNLANWNKSSQDAGGLNNDNFSGSEADGMGSVGNATARSHNGQDTINLPLGFEMINRENVLYADTLPPLDVVMTFGNEYGQAAFQKIYDLDFLNEGSGVSVDSIIMERQMTWIARRISTIMTGIYNASSGSMIPQPVNASKGFPDGAYN